MAEQINDNVQAALAEMLDKERQAGRAEGRAEIITAMTEYLQSLAANTAVPLPSSQPPMDLPIHQLGLQVRIELILKRENFQTVADVYSNQHDLTEIRGMGRVHYAELNDRLVAHGYPKLPRFRG